MSSFFFFYKPWYIEYKRSSATLWVMITFYQNLKDVWVMINFIRTFEEVCVMINFINNSKEGLSVVLSSSPYSCTSEIRIIWMINDEFPHLNWPLSFFLSKKNVGILMFQKYKLRSSSIWYQMCNDTVKMVSHLRKQVPTYKKSSSSQFNLQIFADFFFTKMSMLANNLKCVIFLLRL